VSRLRRPAYSAGGEEEIPGRFAPPRDGARHVAVQRDAVPERLRVHPQPSATPHRDHGPSPRAAVLEPVAHQLRVDAALNVDDVAFADLESHRIGDVAAVGQDHHVARLKDDRALRAALVRKGVDVAAAQWSKWPFSSA